MRQNGPGFCFCFLESAFSAFHYFFHFHEKTSHEKEKNGVFFARRSLF
jgi:hypothetical protein